MAEQATALSLNVVKNGKTTQRGRSKVAEQGRTRVAELSRVVNDRYREFGRLQRRLEARSAKFHARAVVRKCVLVILGALSAANASAQIFDPGSRHGAI